jgi:hypothetical protein
LGEYDNQVYELEESCDLVRLKVHHLNEIFFKKITKVPITSIKTEIVKYLRFRVFQENGSFFKIIQNNLSHQMTFCLLKISITNNNKLKT